MFTKTTTATTTNTTTTTTTTTTTIIIIIITTTTPNTQTAKSPQTWVSYNITYDYHRYYHDHRDYDRYAILETHFLYLLLLNHHPANLLKFVMSYHFYFSGRILPA